MSFAHRIHHTYEEYLSLERASNVKHEYLDGQIYAMAGGTREHAALAAIVAGLLLPSLLRGRCRPHTSDLRVRVPATGLSTYPDVTIICGPSVVDAIDKDAVTNPTLIVEVLSRSTEEYDRGDKFESYRLLPSLMQYVLVSHRERCVEVWTRGEDGGWTSATARDGEVAHLASIGAQLDVHTLYDAAAEPKA